MHRKDQTWTGIGIITFDESTFLRCWLLKESESNGEIWMKLLFTLTRLELTTDAERNIYETINPFILSPEAHLL